MTDPESIKDFVATLYRRVLRREPDQKGLADFCEWITSGKLSISAVVESFFDSAEYKQREHPIAIGEGSVAYRAHGAKHEKQYKIIDPNNDIGSRFYADYMANTNCVSFDFFCPEFERFCNSIHHPVILHRKLWEFAFIAHHLNAKGVLRKHAKGVGFGVGTEPLPSLFASLGCKVLATDAPLDVIDKGWSETKQHSQSRESLFIKSILPKAEFEENVQFSVVDMNSIDKEICDFDFCWSACCFEHLGSLQKGLDFVEASVEKTLKIGGIACHTSEFNLSSNIDTVETGNTVLYRQADIQNFIGRLRRRGHICELLPFNLGASFVDHLVDLPGSGGDVHLKVEFMRFVTTSFGVVVTRGR